jgi:hypothetical protein
MTIMTNTRKSFPITFLRTGCIFRLTRIISKRLILFQEIAAAPTIL